MCFFISRCHTTLFAHIPMPWNKKPEPLALLGLINHASCSLHQLILPAVLRAKVFPRENLSSASLSLRTELSLEKFASMSEDLSSHCSYGNIGAQKWWPRHNARHQSKECGHQSDDQTITQQLHI